MELVKETKGVPEVIGTLARYDMTSGAVHFFAQRREVVEYRKNDQERGKSMKAKKNKRERSSQMRAS